MEKRVTASDAKNNFGGLLEDVTALGRVDVIRHGRLVAIVLSPRELEALVSRQALPRGSSVPRGSTHMIPPELARAARLRQPPGDFGDG